MIAKKTIDEVLAIASVEEVLSDFMTLKRKGASYEGLCPFHNEKTPSFKVNPSKGIYKCFGCGKAGGPLQFVMDHEGLSFIDSIKYLANKYGIEVIEDNSNKSQEYDEAVKKRESLYTAIEFAQNYFVENLQTEEGRIAGLAYLKERGFTQQTIQKFGLGYAPSGFNNFYQTAIKNAYNPLVLLDAGLTKHTEKGDPYDFFRERVMFPFYNVSGRVVAFGGRILKKESKGPKYLNSPETDIYIKSKILYGIFQAKNAIKKQDSCILVEGYTDVISLHQAGIENVVASSGTSLTQEQAALISRFTANVTLLYDGDFAGIKASIRGIDILLEQGLNVRIITLDESEDPDSFAQKHNEEEIQLYFKEKIKDFILFKAEFLYAEAGNDPIKKAEANAEIIKTIGIIPDPLKRAQYVHEFAKISGLNDDLVQAEIFKSKNKEKQSVIKELDENIAFIQQTEINNISANQTTLHSEHHEKALLKLLLKFGHLPYNENQNVAMYVVNQLLNDDFVFSNPNSQIIYSKIIEHLEEGLEINIQQLMAMSENSVSEFVADTLQDNYSLSQAWENNEIFIPREKENYKLDVFSTLLFFKNIRIKILLHQNLGKLKENPSEEAKEKIYIEHKELLKIREQLGKILGIAIT